MEERKELALDLKIMRFKCIKCGKCCSDSKTFVNLTFLDILQIKKGLNIPGNELLQVIGFYTFKDQNVEEFMDQMIYSPIITENGPAYIGILKNENSECVFLDNEKKCKIHDFRPKICKAFPFTFDLKDIEGRESSELDLIYTSKGIDYCPGISKKSPIIKKRKILSLISESLAEINSDHKMIESWNKMVETNQIKPKAAKYINAIVQMQKEVKNNKYNVHKDKGNKKKGRKFN